MSCPFNRSKSSGVRPYYPTTIHALSEGDAMLYTGLILLTGLSCLGLILWALNSEHGHVED